MFDDTAHKSGKLRLLPSLFTAQLRVHKVKTLESMVHLNATVHVNTTVLASDATDGGIRVDWRELGLVRGDREGISGARMLVRT